MIYIENIFHISLMENRDGILTEEGEKAKENKESNTYTLCESMKHSFQNKKRIERKINLTDFLLFSFRFLKKSSGTRKYQQLTSYSKKQCKYILMYITGQIILKNPWLSVSMAFPSRKPTGRNSHHEIPDESSQTIKINGFIHTASKSIYFSQRESMLHLIPCVRKGNWKLETGNPGCTSKSTQSVGTVKCPKKSTGGLQLP